MTPKRFYFVMLGVNLLLLIALVGGVVFGSVVIKEQANKLTKAKVQNKVIEEQQIQLTQAKQDIEKYTELDSITKAIVPQDKDQAKTVREITKLAEESGIILKGIAFNSSSLGQTAAPKAAEPATEGEPTTTAPKPATPAAPALTQVKPVEGITGVYALEIIVTSLESQPVPYTNFITFLEKLESNRRTAHVDKISVKPSDDGSSVSFVLTLNAYVKP